jgi:hypothetical protein
LKKTPTPHTIRLLAVATTLAFVAVGCGGSDSSGAGDTAPQTTTQGTTAGSTETTSASSTETTTAVSGPEPTAADLTVESGFSTGLSDLGTRFTSASAVITNAAVRAACDVQVEFTILDAAGTVLDTRIEKLPIVAAASATPVVPNPLGGGKPDEPAKLEVTVTEVASFATGDTCDTSSTVAKGVTLATADVALDADMKYVRGTVSNPSQTDVDAALVACVFRGADKAIVGGDKTTARTPLAAGASADFKVRVLWAPPAATTAECGATA